MKKKVLTRERAIALMNRYEEQRLLFEDGRAEEIAEIEADGMLLPFEYMSNEDLLEELVCLFSSFGKLRQRPIGQFPTQILSPQQRRGDYGRQP